MYILPEDVHDCVENPVTDSFSVFHINICSIKFFFESFNTFLFSLDFTLSIICSLETWFDGSDNFIYNFSNYTSTNRKRSDRRDRSVPVYIHSSLKFKTRPDLVTNCRDIESIALEMITEKTYNTVLHSVLHRPPNGHFGHFENFLTFFLNTNNFHKSFYFEGDFNINLLDNNLNKKVQYYLNVIYQNSFIPIISKPTRVTRKPSTITNHILTNLFVNTNFKTFILKIDISGHFSVFFQQPTSRPREENKATSQQ